MYIMLIFRMKATIVRPVPLTWSLVANFLDGISAML